MNATEVNFLNRPIANVSFVTSPLLKLHGRIVTIFQPLNGNENRLWQVVKRIATLLSSLIVYPGLGILMLASYISTKFSRKEENMVQNLFNREIDSARSHFDKLKLSDNPCWAAAARVDFDGTYCFLANYSDSFTNDNYLLNVAPIKERLATIDSKKFQLDIKFIIVDRNMESPDSFNIYSYVRKIESKNREKSSGGYAENTLVPQDAAKAYLKDSFNFDGCSFFSNDLTEHVLGNAP